MLKATTTHPNETLQIFLIKEQPSHLRNNEYPKSIEPRVTVYARVFYKPSTAIAKMPATLIVFCFMVVAAQTQICNASTREVILNEDDFHGSCQSTCADIGALYDQYGCTVISGCRLNTAGWTRGFVRCDFCSCTCEADPENRDIVVEKRPKNFKEEDLYGVCTGTCDTTDGLIRSDYEGCQEVRDCRFESQGYLSGFVRCDNCVCDCINHKRAVSYELRNVQYDFSEAVVNDGEPAALSQTVLENKGLTEQVATTTVSLKYRKTETMETSESLEMGLSVSVSAGFDLFGADIGLDFSASVNSTWMYTSGSSTTNEKTYSVTPTIMVPPASTIIAVISGSVMKIDVPYTADLVRTFKDGTKSSPTPTSGFYSGVQTGRFTITYEEPIAAGICEEGEAFNSSCYIFDHSAEITFDEAKEECSSRGFILASVHSAEEQLFLTQLMKPDVDYAIGLSDKAVENTFVWVDGSDLDYTNWGLGRPADNVSSGNQDCVGIRSSDRTWIDYPCDTVFTAYICQHKSEDADGILAKLPDLGLTGGAIIAIVVAISILFIFTIIVCIYCSRRRKNSASSTERTPGKNNTYA